MFTLRGYKFKETKQHVASMSDHELASRFNCIHYKDDCSQDHTNALRLLREFMDTLSERFHFLSQSEIDTIQTLVLPSFDSVIWYPDYGSSVVIIPAKFSECHIRVVALDNWKFKCVSSAGSTTCHTTKCHGSSLLDLPNILSSSILNLKHKAYKTIRKSIEKKRYMLTPGTGGFQRTPAFIHAVYSKCITDSPEELLPQGGTTDVGQHTGNKPRNTAFPLVIQTLFQLMKLHEIDSYLYLFQRLMVLLDFYTFDNMIAPTLRDLSVRNVDTCIEIYHAIQRKLEELAMKGLNTSIALASAYGYVTAISTTRMSLWKQKCVENQLPEGEVGEDSFTSVWELPHIRLTDYRNPTSSKLINLMAELNLGVSMISKPNCDFEQLHVFLDIVSGRGKNKTTYILATEKYLFDFALKKWHDKKEIGIPSPLSMKKLILRYNDIVQKVLSNYDESWRVNLLSRKILCNLIGYCYVDSYVVARHPFCAKFGVSIDYSLLEFLVLRKKQARCVQRVVSEYLKKRSTTLPLFDLNNQYPTMIMVDTFVQGSENIQNQLDREEKNAKRLITERWETVQRKQAASAEIRAKISSLHIKIGELKPRTTFVYHPTTEELYDIRVAEQEKRKLTAQLKRHQDSLSSLQIPPNGIIFSLPEDKTKAGRVLFFLQFFPKEMQILSFFSVTVNNMLRGDTKNTSRYYYGIPNCWYQFVSNHVSTQHWRTQEESEYMTITGTKLSYKNIQKTDDIRNPRDGVYFQDGQEISMRFGNQTKFNSGSSFLLDLLTPKIPATNLQWVVNIYSGCNDKTRGNRGIASQHLKPKEMTKKQFLTFCSLRSYPNRQYKCLLEVFCSFIEGESLISAPSFSFVIRQMLFHTGPLSNDSCYPEWAQDLGCKEFEEQLCQILDMCADRIEDFPRKHRCMKILAECTSFFSQWYPQCMDITHKMISTCLKWAEQCESSEMVNLNVYRKSKAKQCLYYCYALWCLCLSPELSLEQAALVCRLMAQINLGTLFKDYASSTVRNDIETMYQLCLHIASERSQELHSLLSSSTQERNKILTAALRSVVSLPMEIDVPNWRNHESRDYNSSIYSTNFGGAKYHFNLLNGIVTIDGNLIGRLPAKIRESNTFKRSFGSRDFEITREQGLMRTIASVDGYSYEFGVSDFNILIREIDSQGNPLELLSHTLFKSLPERVRQLNSFYHSPSKQMIVVRPIEWDQREIHYLILSDGSCYKVPYEERNVPWYQHNCLLYEKLITPLSGSLLERRLRILSKFEVKKFIHVLLTPTGAIKYSFPRFDLQFVDNSSLQYSGYYLAPNQLLEDNLVGFSNYVVLHSAGKATKILVPHWELSQMDSNYDIKIDIHCYDIHRRLGHLLGQSRESLLFLAAVYMKIDCLLPTGSRTPSEEALSLIQSAFECSPLTSREQQTIKIIQKASYRCSAVYLLIQDLQILCSRISPLFDKKETEIISSTTTSDMKIIYQQEFSARFSNPRRRISSIDERRIFGTKILIDEPIKLRNVIEIGEIPVSLDVVENSEKMLSELVTDIPDSTILSEFPISIDTTNDLGKELEQEEISSWKAISAQCSKDVQLSPSLFTTLLKTTKNQLSMVETFLTSVLSPQQSSELGRSFPIADKRDFLLFACDSSDSYVAHFNPLLSPDSVVKVRRACILWMKLCVLEDKLNRLQQLLSQEKLYERKSMIIEELMVTREWQAEKHPEWLVFEVEQQIQIRNLQYSVCSSLLNLGGSIAQMNMGQGKTRVILPMLILEWSKQKGKCTRVHILHSIINEALHYFRSTLSQSVLHLKIFEMPFHRQVELNEHTAQIISFMVEHCSESGAALVVAPECRMSLEMRVLQLENSLLGMQLCHRVLANSYQDLFDEVDVMLPNWELVYSIGESNPLPNNIERWHVIDSVLLLFRKPTENLRKLLARDNVCERDSPTKNSEEFVRLRFIDSKEFDESAEALRETLAEELFQNPPSPLEWLQQHPKSNEIKKYIIDPSVDKPPEFGSNETWRQCVLALRGLLAGDILFHCLKKRDRVNYGIAQNHQKQIAVPFRAADCPAERAEYSHPDCAVVFTKLAYYYEGLSRRALQQTLSLLLEMGVIAQNAHYDSWFKLSSPRLSPEIRHAINHASKIDVTNPNLLNELYDAFKKNPLTINFWLNNCILPYETMVYSCKLVGSGWNLAHNLEEMVVGFSGTNDNKRLLPLPLKQISINHPELIGTNAKMISLIRSQAQCYTLENSSPSSILELCVRDEEISVLIDAGGLMAGLSNREVAVALLDTGKHVVYFDLEHADWMMMDNRQTSKDLRTAPKLVSECFVFFDESRCRGADMKLNSDAVAMLTVGPKMRRDQLTQAAGRMRGLHRGQKLKIYVLPEVQRILGDDSVDCLLSWCINNVTEHTRNGLLRWAEQGITFATRMNCDLSDHVMDENFELERLYQESQSPVLVTKLTSVIMKRNYDLEKIQTKGKQYLENILRRVSRYGEGQYTNCNLDQQCERELEIEAEKEKEVEVSVPQQTPHAEKDWNYSLITVAKSISDLCIDSVLSVSQFAERKFNLRFISVAWGKEIFLTKNFFKTVENFSYSDHLRNISGVLKFEDGNFLLLSECETDQILPFFWNASASPSVELLFYGITYPAQFLPVSLHMFAGTTMYDSSQLTELLHVVLDPKSETQAIEILRYRKLIHYLDCSHLEKAIQKAHMLRASLEMGEPKLPVNS